MLPRSDLLSQSMVTRSPTELARIIRDGGSLKQVLDHTSFLEELSAQKPYLTEFLRLPNNLKTLIMFVTQSEDSKLPRADGCKYAFLAFTVLTTPNYKITESLLKSTELLQQLFLLAKADEERYATAQGYFLGIVRMLLSDLNVLKEEFINIVCIDAKTLIYPILQNMTASNAGIIKEILSNPTACLQSIQTSIFDYLLYFYLNEKFFAVKRGVKEYMFDNLVSIIRFLAQENIRYNYKMKYESNLYSDKNIRVKEYWEDLFYLRVVLLKYIAVTGQIKSFDSPVAFLSMHKKYLSSKRRTVVTKEIVSFLRIISGNKEFLERFDIALLRELLAVLEVFPLNDVIQVEIFSILKNSSKQIEKDQASMKVLMDFYAKVLESSSLPGQSRNKMNSFSLGFLAELISLIHEPVFGNEEEASLFISLQQKLLENFRKFPVDQSLSDSSIVHRSNLVVILKNQLDMMKFSEKLNEDGKSSGFEIMPIISAELIKSRESLSNSSVVLDSGSIDSELLKTEIHRSKTSFISSFVQRRNSSNSTVFENSFVSEENGTLLKRVDQETNSILEENSCLNVSLSDIQREVQQKLSMGFLQVGNPLGKNQLDTSSYVKKED
jgi:hypothetical protein